MTIREALDGKGPLVAIWDEAVRDNAQVVLYSLADPKPRFVATEELRKEERSRLTADLRTRGLRIGSCAGSGPYMWIQDDRFTVFSEDRITFEATRSMVSIGELVIAPSHVTRIVTFIDDDARGHRGVQLELDDGRLVVVAEEHDETADLDPTYGWDIVVIDALWASRLGRDLAAWLSVPHRDEIL
jgi:hypothetical protein